MQPRLRIIILPRKPQVENKLAEARRILLRQTVTEGFRFPALDDAVVFGVGDFSRRAQVVGVDVVKVGCGAGRRCRFQHRYRQVAQPDDFLDQLAGGVVFAGQVSLFVVDILRGVAGYGFADALAEAVVANGV